MSPTLIPSHRKATCPLCGGKVALPAPLEREIGFPHDHFGMCLDCQQGVRVEESEGKVFLGDHIMVNKLLKPRRWDLVAFRYPPDPKSIYVDRLIGLPGEEVVIKEGAIWINGERQTPPADIATLTFTTKLEGGMETDFGRREEPMRLKENELFVLGDFALRSSDSRDWGPVPVENVVGVADLIYWPPDRWRRFR